MVARGFRKRLPLFLALLLLPVCTSPVPGLAVENNELPTVENSVSECLQYEPIAIRNEGQLRLLEANVRLIKSTGECGCTSKLLAYRVAERFEASGRSIESIRVVGDMLSDPAPSTMLFMLEGDHRIPLRGALTLVISCKQSE